MATIREKADEGNVNVVGGGRGQGRHSKGRNSIERCKYFKLRAVNKTTGRLQIWPPPNMIIYESASQKASSEICCEGFSNNFNPI